MKAPAWHIGAFVDFVGRDGETRISLPWAVAAGTRAPRHRRHTLALAQRIRVRAASGEILLDEPTALGRLVASMT